MSKFPIRRNILNLFEEMNQENIMYCHWKSNEHLSEGLTGENDLDILVHKGDTDKFEKIAIKNGFVKDLIRSYVGKYEISKDDQREINYLKKELT